MEHKVLRKTNQEGSQSLTDSDLARWLSTRHSECIHVAYANAKHLFKVFEIHSQTTELTSADLGKESIKVLKKLAKAKILKGIELPYNELRDTQNSDPEWLLVSVNCSDINELIKKRERLFLEGRGNPISTKTAATVWHEAGGRCMYSGCGCDLGSTPLTTKAARIAYLAHIVASNPDGPRGNESSHALSDDPENIMLMCDAHHRLIDRIDVEGHPTRHLRQMREAHTDRVRILLDSLQCPSAQIITLLADLAQTPTNVSRNELIDSILSRGLGPLPEIKNMVRRTQRDDRDRNEFWKNLLIEHDTDIRELINLTSNKPSQSSLTTADTLAVFPLHLVPMLILFGRIIGEARNVEIFQYNRDLRTWRWTSSSSSADNPFTLNTEHCNLSESKHTILSFELTANLDIDALPDQLKQAVIKKTANWIRVQSNCPDPNCIESSERLSDFTKLARQAINTVQDSWQSKHVHLFGICPASALFKVGQMLQAGHHSVFTVYDRPKGSMPFVPALQITGDKVRSVGSDLDSQHEINLR